MTDQEADDPDEEDKQVQEQEEVKETEAKPKEEPKADVTPPKTVSIVDHNTGDNYDLSPQEVVDLAQWAIMQNSNKEKDKETPKEEISDSDRFTKLEDKIKSMETQAINEKRGQVIMDTINKTASKFDLTKEGGPLTEKIKMMTLIKLTNNPRLDPATVFAEETKSYMDIFESRNQKNIANDKVRGALESTLRGGSMPVVDTTQKFTAADLKGQGSEQAMKRFLESQ